MRAAARPKRSKKAAATLAGIPLPSTTTEPRTEECEKEDGSALYIKLPVVPYYDNRKAVIALGEHHVEKFKALFPQFKTFFQFDPPTEEKDQMLTLVGDMECPATDLVVKTPEKVQRSLSIDEAEKLLSFFRKMAPLFPFVVVPEGETVKSLSRTSPFLLLAILASASMHDVQLHHALDHEFRRILSSEVIMKGKKSLDFLQGVLVYTAW